MTYISTNGKLSRLTMMVLSFAIFLLLHNFATPLYALSVEKGLSQSNPTSYPPIIPTSSASPDSADNHPYHQSSSSSSSNNQHHEQHQHGSDGSNNQPHHSSSSSNNQHHEQHQHGSHSSDASDGSDAGTDIYGSDGNNAFVQINNQ